MPGESRPPVTTIGRFELVEQLGEGGMGIVYVARDTVLDRRVALKLVHPGRTDSERARHRMLREAQALARLSHDNVVAIYEADLWREQVYVAMELVEGRTLADVAAAGDLEPLETWALLEQAGRGLAAAHAAALVHRDFKPSNVLVGRAGRVKVCDFGLARVHEDRVTHATPAAVADDQLTVTGALLGTPRYMAPEQHRGAPVDARADQFAFCVVACELLFGHAPFEATTYAELATSVLDGRATITPNSSMPAEVAHVLERGLSAVPADRYASMSELLAALGDALEPLRSPDLACRRLIDRAWNQRIRDEMRAAFVATGRWYAEDIWSQVCAVLDRYCDLWVTERAVDLEASSVPGLGAIDDDLTDLRTVLDLFIRACDVDTVDRAIEIAFSLPPPAVRRPHHADVGVEAAYRQLSQGRAFRHAGRLALAQEHLEAAAAGAAELGSDALVGEAHLLLAHVALDHEDVPGAETHLRRTLRAAAVAHDDALLAKAWGHLAAVIGYFQPRVEDSRLACRVAEVAALRTDDRLAQSWVLNDIGVVHLQNGDMDEALHYLRRSAALKRDLLGSEHPDTAATEANIAQVLRMLGRAAEARDALKKHIVIAERYMGVAHHDLALKLDELADAHIATGEPTEALDVCARALALRADTFGEHHRSNAQTLLVRADAQLVLGDRAGALATVDTVLDIIGAIEGHRHLARALFCRARATWDTDPIGARACAERALAEPGTQRSERALISAIERWLSEHPERARS